MKTLAVFLFSLCLFSWNAHGDSYDTNEHMYEYNFRPILVKDIPCYSRKITLGGQSTVGEDYVKKTLNIIIFNNDPKSNEKNGKICIASTLGNLVTCGFSNYFFYVSAAESMAKSIETAVNIIDIADKNNVIINMIPLSEFSASSIKIDTVWRITITTHPELSQNCVAISCCSLSKNNQAVIDEESICFTKEDALKLASALKTAKNIQNNGNIAIDEIKNIIKQDK